MELPEEYLREHMVDELKPLSGLIRVVDYNPEWPRRFAVEVERIKGALGERALRVEHVGSTSVPGLAAKPVIDILLVVSDAGKEKEYLPALEDVGYQLRIREPEWHEHRMLRTRDADVNVHVFSVGCAEIERMLAFRDWLRGNARDRELYARTKRALADRDWKYTQNYADAKTTVVEEILSRMREAGSAP